jgi:hypothetical protein
MILPILERDKINYNIPVFTLDVNQIPLNDPSTWTPPMNNLINLEWNYFKGNNIELCVTPETPEEIMRGAPTAYHGHIAYTRFQKSQLFKSRPAGTTLTLNEQDSNTLWLGIRGILFPTVDDAHLTFNHRSDVSQVFFHTVASGSLSSSVFITMDDDILRHGYELQRELGITVLNPNNTWEEFQPRYGLYSPSQTEIRSLYTEQRDLFDRLKTEASK